MVPTASRELEDRETTWEQSLCNTKGFSLGKVSIQHGISKAVMGENTEGKF